MVYLFNRIGCILKIIENLKGKSVKFILKLIKNLVLGLYLKWRSNNLGLCGLSVY